MFENFAIGSIKSANDSPVSADIFKLDADAKELVIETQIVDLAGLSVDVTIIVEHDFDLKETPLRFSVDFIDTKSVTIN